MGCSTSIAALAAAAQPTAAGRSRPRGPEPAALCRERVALIRAAADRRFALAAAHAAYFRELAAVGAALRRFAAAALAPAASSSPASPVLTLPGSPAKAAAAAATGRLSPRSSSSSTVTPLSHSLSDDSLEPPPQAKPLEATSGSGGGGESPSYNYMRQGSSTPAMVYENPTYYNNGERYGFGYGYPPYGELFGEERPVAPERAPEQPPAPPPPPAPDVSPWDFFDPFVHYDQFLEDYSYKKEEIESKLRATSPNEAELREKEGIPDLEDEAELEVETSEKAMEEVADGGKYSASTVAGSKGMPDENVTKKDSATSSAGSKGRPEGKGERGGEKQGKSGTARFNARKSSGDDDSSSGKKKAVTFEEDKSLAAEEDGGSHGKSLSAMSSESFSPLHHGDRDVIEAMDEIKEQFDVALNCGAEVARLLEVGKVPYRAKPRVLRYFCSRMVDPLVLHVPTSCIPKPQNKNPRWTSSKASSSSSSLSSGKNGISNLSSTLEKLYVWEKKLYLEVKDGRKLRLLYEEKYEKLKSLDERGAEPNTIDSIRLLVTKLRTNISVNVKSVNSISKMIHKIRDEELNPQLIDLVQGLKRMWKEVLDCHEQQLSVIKDSRTHLIKAVTISQSNVAAKATMELERELAKWYRCFNKWVSLQKSYVEAMNGWLKKWLPEEQEEETPDGVPPFSPGRLGAPPAFIISNDWFQAIDRISHSKVSKSLDHFAKLVHEFRKRQEEEHRQKIKVGHASRFYEKKLKVLHQQVGFTGDLDVALTERSVANHDERVMELERLRKRRDEERLRHEEVMKHTHFAASATLPAGLIPALEQLVAFFSENLQFYKGIRTSGT